MFSGSLSPYLKPTVKNTVSDATLKQVADDILECKRPVLVFCPRLGADHMPVRLEPVAFATEWRKARGVLPQQYHEDLIEMFAAVVNSGSDKDYNSAATRYRQMFGEDGKNDTPATSCSRTDSKIKADGRNATRDPRSTSSTPSRRAKLFVSTKIPSCKTGCSSGHRHRAKRSTLTRLMRRWTGYGSHTTRAYAGACYCRDGKIH